MRSQHPADLKPRGVKAPLHLIPWSAVPSGLIPEGLEAAAWLVGAWPDGDEAGPWEGPITLADALAANAIVHAGIDAVARVFEHGANKYARDNWRSFTWDKAAEDAYFGAICRHLHAIQNGEEIDPESGEPHRAHVGAGALIWVWHERRAR